MVDSVTPDFRRLDSELDESVNFVADAPVGGLIEARYVRRCEHYAICYVSSQADGCRMKCRHCFLTQSGEITGLVNLDLEGYLAQVDVVLGHYRTQPPAEVLHVNFMARGEALENPTVLERGDELLGAIYARAQREGLVPRAKVSTIMPPAMADRELIDVFPLTQPDIYYSLYSADPGFRRRWLPNALPLEDALGKLARWQRLTRKIPVIHWALIAGENDSPADMEAICEAVRASGLRPDVNLVRYNPFAPNLGEEPGEEVIQDCALGLSEGLPGSEVKVVSRIGFDVKASCGMFVPGPRARRSPRSVGAAA